LLSGWGIFWDTTHRRSDTGNLPAVRARPARDLGHEAVLPLAG